ncbi:MAG: flagellar hook protein FlgE [Psychromonas sp.]|nr:flagellar hook protein FlgE [Psychromonas sp.]
MSFNVALSGISAAQTDLDATSNNIANVNTVGFKESRAEFDSVYANSLFSNSQTKTGDGASVAAVAQQFSQGSLKFTDNPLDLAITGSGFFATSGELAGNDLSYTRSGTFKLNSENFIVDNSGNYLQAFPVNTDGSSSSVSLSTTEPVQIPETAGTPVPTTDVDITLNLPAADPALDPAEFNPEDPATYNNATSVTIYDSLGEAHVASTYYVKPKDASYTGTNQWITFVTVDGKPVDAWDAQGDMTANPPRLPGAVAGSYDIDADGDGVADGTPQSAQYTDANGVTHTGAVLSFDAIGGYMGSQPANLTFEPLGVGGANVLDPGADGTQALKLNFNDPTQFASAFEVTALEQDGLTVGRLTGVEIADDGLVKATYSNGTSQPLSRISVVRFRNEQGLSQSGSGWIASQNSGEPIAGEAGSGSFGSINSAALEQSNVNLTTELVDLISAQRNFQANSRSLEISNQLQQNILQIR